MKKFLIPLVILLMTILIVGCGAAEPTTPAAPTTPTTPATPTTPTTPSTPTTPTTPTTPSTPAKPTTPSEPSKPATPKPTGQPQYGKTIRLGISSDPSWLGAPWYYIVPTAMTAATPCIEPLVYLDETGAPIPHLLSSWEEDPDSASYTLTCQKGVKFHDGTEWNAKSLKWNLDSLISHKGMGTQGWVDTDIIDDYTVRLNLKKWDSTVISNMYGNAGKIVSPTLWETHDEDYATSHPVGTGPYEFVSWERDKSVKYRRFDGYWKKGLPYMTTWEVQVITDSLTREFALRKGDIDLCDGLDVKNWATLEKDGYVLLRQPSPFTYNLAPDASKPDSPWADIRVRKAAQYAIDQKALINAVLSGEGTPCNQLVANWNWGNDPSVVGYPYDPDKAKALMAEAGYANGFKTKITYATSTQDDMLASAIQGMLGKIGIQCELNRLQRAAYNQIAKDNGTWDGLLLPGPMTGRTDAAAPLIEYVADPTFFADMLKPDDVLEAIYAGQSAKDFETKKTNVRKAVSLITDKYCSLIFLYNSVNATVLQPYVHDSGFGGRPGTTIWYTPETAWIGNEKPVIK